MEQKSRSIILISCLLTSLVMTNGNLDYKTSQNLNKIENTIGKQTVGSTLDKIKDFLKSDDGTELGKAIPKTIEAIGESVQSIITNDPLEIVKGILGITASFATLIPSAGPIVGTAFNLLSIVLDAVGGVGTPSMGAVVKQEIEKALDKFADSQLKAEAYGAEQVFRVSQAYLSNKGKHQLQQHELASLGSNVPVYQNVKIIGILEYKIQMNIVKRWPPDFERAAQYLKLYATLATLRSAIIWQLIALSRTVDNSDFTNNAYKSVADSNAAVEKAFLTFLVNPELSRAAFHGLFNPSQWPLITKFVKARGLKFQNLSSLKGKRTLAPQKWPNWLLSMDYRDAGTLRIIKEQYFGTGEQFYFDLISELDNTFFIRSVARPNRYAYMKRDGRCSGTTTRPGPEGQWKLVRYGPSQYLLSTLKKGNCHLRNTELYTWGGVFFIKDRVECRTGDPGAEGHWFFK